MPNTSTVPVTPLTGLSWDETEFTADLKDQKPTPLMLATLLLQWTVDGTWRTKNEIEQMRGTPS